MNKWGFGGIIFNREVSYISHKDLPCNVCRKIFKSKNALDTHNHVEFLHDMKELSDVEFVMANTYNTDSETETDEFFNFNNWTIHKVFLSFINIELFYAD